MLTRNASLKLLKCFSLTYCGAIVLLLRSYYIQNCLKLYATNLYRANKNKVIKIKLFTGVKNIFLE